MKNFLLSLLTFFALNATAGDIVKVQRVAKSMPAKPTAMSYQATKGTLRLPATLRRTAANGLTANFSVQTESAYVTVWNENFDSDERDAKGNLTLKGWTLNQGEGNVISFTKKQSDFSTIDENDTYSLYIDGPYQAFKRTKASATSSEISVPANGQLHAYIKMNPTWNSYVTLALQVSADDFTTTEEVWNSKTITEGKSQWVAVDADLAAYAGKNIKIRIFWGPGTDDSFNTGGYMGDFYVDGISVTGVGSVDQISVKAGDPIHFVDLTTGKQPTSWQWQFPGGVPEKSNEQNPTVHYEQSGIYDVVLKVSDGEATDEVVKTAFVEVTGEAPKAGVVYPADFRTLAQPRMRMIAPLAPVVYEDASTGYPTSYSWMLYTPYDLAKQAGSLIFNPDTVYTTPNVNYCHNKLGKTYVTHIVQNAEGYAFTDDSVQVQFDGFVSNFQPKDGYQTNFVDGDLTLPGANKMGIKAWAERISKPSVPVVLEAMYVNFTKASATALTDQISPVSFTLYTSENGLPGHPIELLDSWNLSELNYALNTNNGMVTIELGHRVVIDKEVFLVIDGIPEKNDSMECAIAMAPMRDYGNTAFFLRNGQWRPFTGYFQTAPGGQTSLAVFPYFTHSVLIPAQVDAKGGITMASDTTLVPANAGKRDILVFANQGIYKYLGSNADWCRITGKPGEYTVDSVSVEFDELPAGVEYREAVISVTDSIQTLNLVVRQDRNVTNAIQMLPTDHKATVVELFDINGRRIDNARKARGIYIERRGNQIRKVVKK